jgi:hypothetical protein
MIVRVQPGGTPHTYLTWNALAPAASRPRANAVLTMPDHRKGAQTGIYKTYPKVEACTGQEAHTARGGPNAIRGRASAGRKPPLDEIPECGSGHERSSPRKSWGGHEGHTAHTVAGSRGRAQARGLVSAALDSRNARMLCTDPTGQGWPHFSNLEGALWRPTTGYSRAGGRNASLSTNSTAIHTS